MKKKLIFKVRGIEVDSIDGAEINLQEIESLKVTMAFAHGVGSQDIEVVTEDVIVRELSKLSFISPQGLHFKSNNEYAIFRAVKSIRPAFEIKSEDGFQKFLDMIFEKDIDNAITFN